MTKYDKIKVFVFAPLQREATSFLLQVGGSSKKSHARERGGELFVQEGNRATVFKATPPQNRGGGKVCQPRCDGDTKRAQIISEETPTSPGFTVAGHQLAMRVAKERASPRCRPIVRVSSAG